MPFEQAEHHRTGRPVTVRPMTRRWISDVPSKMVKIFGALRTALLSPVYAGKWADSSAWLGLERPPTTPDAPGLLPGVLPTEGLTSRIGAPPADWPFISYDPTTYPPLPQPEPNRPTRRERLTRFVSLLVIRTGAYVTAFLGVYVLATGQI